MNKDAQWCLVHTSDPEAQTLQQRFRSRSRTTLISMVLRKKGCRRLKRVGFCLMEDRASEAQVRQIQFTHCAGKLNRTKRHLKVRNQDTENTNGMLPFLLGPCYAKS